ncbi:MAG TPA: HipA family kinase [Gemmatimonadales bacterium]|nr:HipA family kinase [Gemmatimonadales bacterium]
MRLPVYSARRYVQPLREGGSLPAIVDTDAGLFVVKFRGAGQGPKALIAELIVGLLAGKLGLPVPEPALIDVAAAFGRAEPDPEIQEILRGSHGINAGARYLDGAFNFDPFAARDCITPGFASDLVWFDAYTTNPDRTYRNPNIMIWQRTPWLIDHGAAIYAHHSWSTADVERTRTPFPLIEDHVLLAQADDVEGSDRRLAELLSDKMLKDVLSAVPDALLRDPLIADEFPDAEAARKRYHEYLSVRLAEPRFFVTEAIQARERRLGEPIERRRARR